MIPFETIRKIMKEETNGTHISEKAIVVMATHVEEYIRNVTNKSMIVLNEMNKCRNIQGLKKQQRLNEKCVQTGINYNNQERILTLSGENQKGGKKQKGEKNDQETPKYQTNKGVEII